VSATPTRSWRTGLRSRIALVIALLALLTLTTAGWLLLRLSRDLAQQAQREQGVALLQSMAPSAARAIAIDDLARLDDQLFETVREVKPSWTRILYLQAYDASGHSLLRASDGSAEAERAATAVPAAFVLCALEGDEACWHYTSEPEHELLLYVSVPANSGLRWGTLVAAFDVQSLEWHSQQWARNALALIVGLAAVLYLSIWFGLSRVVMAPLGKLTNAALRMGEGDLSARAELARDDELGKLGQIFDGMASRLEAHTTELEQKVAERSAQIHQQNEELERVNERLAGINSQLERLATTDALTGLHNRRYLQQAIDFELARAKRVERPFCLLMLDIDHFKRVNDSYGHQVGDRVLETVADLMVSNLRNTDLRARWGGEEFVALLLDSDLEAGLHTAEKIRAVIANSEFHAGLLQPVRVTISIGVACFPKDGCEERELFAYADAALYRAKNAGRNRVEC
jgi:diguanylate cyclase (GGDEF)-like protein